MKVGMVMIAILVAIILFNGCLANEAKNSIVGTWVYKSDIGNMVFSFNNDGTGMSTVFGQTFVYSYTTTNDTIFITFEGNKHVTKYPYKKMGTDTLLINVEGIQGTYLSFDRR